MLRTGSNSSTMQVINQSKHSVVASEVKQARSLWSRFVGLMGRRGLAEGHGLLLEPASSIHTFFMRFPIDLVFIDRGGVVTKVAHDVRPFRVVMGRRSRSVLELSAGAAANAGIEAGDVLAISD